ncbi:hypothetical protein PybrP1_006091 [[Pythium] brassicae (nom. inval.)]|nr:hypothetical protein PybrP1_006091 [[Pythium] brassicae (nom. inval.)]
MDSSSALPEHRGSGSSSGKKPLLLNRSAEEVRRNGLNMEKMIKKNVLASSRPGTLKRGLAVVEYFKNKQGDASGADVANNSSSGGDDVPPKRTKVSPSPQASTPVRAGKSVSFTVPRDASSAAAAEPAAEAALASVSSPSPRRSASHAKTSLLLSAKATTAGVQALDDRAFAPRGPPSITRLSQQLTSPLRHRNSPVRSRIQAMTEETMRRISETASASASAAAGGVGKGLTAALEQVDVAPPARTSTSKSPFQSFQSKFTATAQGQRSPAKTPPLSTLLASPVAAAPARPLPPRSGPAVVDLSQSAAADKPPPTPTRPSGSSLATVLSARSPKPAAAPPKPARALFGSSARKAVASKSMCFSTEGVATSLDVSPDGEIVVVGYTDGSVRLYEMDSNVPSDRHGYLLGHLDEESSQSAANANLRVKITADGRYVFNDDEDFEHLQKYFHSHPRLRGFSDVAKYVAPHGKATSNAYYLVTGLGVKTLNMWRFEEPSLASGAGPAWDCLYTLQANGNTAIVAEFLPGANGALMLATTCEDRNMRVWELEASASSAAHESDSGGNDTGDDEDDALAHRSGSSSVHVVKAQQDIPNTKDITAIFGDFAYGIGATGEAYRLSVRDPSLRQTFDLEKLDSGGGASSKSRRSTVLLESVYASDDGKVMIAVSTDGVFYYSSDVGREPATPSFLRIIGRNASLNPQYKTPMKVYTPQALEPSSAAGKAPPPALEPMMAVVTNPQSEDDGGDGYFNVDPTEGFAARWRVPSRGRDCWVCGVRNVSHWQAPSEQQQQKAAAAQQEISERKQRRQQRTPSASSDRRASVDAPSPSLSSGYGGGDTPVRAKAKAKKPFVSSKPVGGGITVASSPSVAQGKPPSGSSKKARQRIEADDDDGASGGGSGSGSGGRASTSADAPSGELSEELERYKDRYNKIVMEWQRRLKGERQMRRLWKTRETEFNSELDDTLEKLYAAEQELLALKEQHKDAEKRYSIEKLKAEQQCSVKVRYEQLCEHMADKLAQVDDQKRVLEQTTRTLLQEVDRNARSLKSAALLERNECVVCKDKEATTAIIPCGHLVFCEEDSDVYRRSSPANHVVCPVCQRELISFLRIYS